MEASNGARATLGAQSKSTRSCLVPCVLKSKRVCLPRHERLRTSGGTHRRARAFAQQGTSKDANRLVPDYAMTFEVTPRNLNLGR